MTTVVKGISYDGLRIPVVTNEKALAADSQLLQAEPEDDEALKAPFYQKEEAGVIQLRR